MIIKFSQYSIICEAAYNGNIGIIELIKFYEKASPDVVKKVKALIAQRDSAAAWDIVQKTLGIKLHKSVNEENTQGDIGTDKLTQTRKKQTPGEKPATAEPLRDFETFEPVPVKEVSE